MERQRSVAALSSSEISDADRCAAADGKREAENTIFSLSKGRDQIYVHFHHRSA